MGCSLQEPLQALMVRMERGALVALGGGGTKGWQWSFLCSRILLSRERTWPECDSEISSQLEEINSPPIRPSTSFLSHVMRCVGGTYQQGIGLQGDASAKARSRGRGKSHIPGESQKHL